MKIFSTLILASILLLCTNTFSQTTITSGDLPADIQGADGILYFKMKVIELDTIAPVDVSVSLSDVPIVAWADYSCQVRTREDQGYIDARDQGNVSGNAGTNNYVVVDTIKWEFGKMYHVWISIHYNTFTYDVYVFPEGQENIKTIGKGAGFRKQTNPLLLWSVLSGNSSGSIEVTDLKTVSEVVKPITSSISTLANSQLSYSQISGQLKLEYNLSASAQVNISISDLSGRIYFVENNYRLTGQNTLVVNTSNFATGYYLINTSIGNNRFTNKVFFKK